uniref:Glutathione S-transferase C-terminal domain-containing protein n=1 Tax=Acanthochromis polyacanthus TaxID=80966 RepID=A0A3Q1F4Q5_9TELE
SEKISQVDAAIVEYLAQKHSAPDHWCPAELQQRARLTEYLNWQPMNIALHFFLCCQALYPVVTDTEVPKEKMDEVLADAKQSLTLLQDKFLQDKPFIIGDKISAADLVAVLWIMQVTQNKKNKTQNETNGTKQNGQNITKMRHKMTKEQSSI